jgi:acyl-CoA dehydrogenase
VKGSGGDELAQRTACAVEVLAGNAAVADETARLPEANVEALRRSGLLGLLVPHETGGLGGRLHDLVDVGIELGGACASTAMVWAMHCQQVDAIVRFGDNRLRADLLPKLARGEELLASITTEAETGAHLTVAASALGDATTGLVLDRVGPVVSAARHADGFLVTMRRAEHAAPGEVSLVYVDRATAEVELDGTWDAMGMRGTESVRVRLQATVPLHHVVGPPGRFRDVVADSFGPLAHVAWAAVWLGAARAAVREVVTRLRKSAETTRILESDLAATRLGRARLGLDTVGAFLRSIVDLVEGARQAGRPLSGTAAQLQVNGLKVAASEGLLATVDELVDLVGLTGGYTRAPGCSLERIYRDLRSAPLNYRNDRLLAANGRLALLDLGVSVLG